MCVQTSSKCPNPIAFACTRSRSIVVACSTPYSAVQQFSGVMLSEQHESSRSLHTCIWLSTLQKHLTALPILLFLASRDSGQRPTSFATKRMCGLPTHHGRSNHRKLILSGYRHKYDQPWCLQGCHSVASPGSSTHPGDTTYSLSGCSQSIG